MCSLVSKALAYCSDLVHNIFISTFTCSATRLNSEVNKNLVELLTRLASIILIKLGPSGRTLGYLLFSPPVCTTALVPDLPQHLRRVFWYPYTHPRVCFVIVNCNFLETDVYLDNYFLHRGSGQRSRGMGSLGNWRLAHFVSPVAIFQPGH